MTLTVVGVTDTSFVGTEPQIPDFCSRQVFDLEPYYRQNVRLG